MKYIENDGHVTKEYNVEINIEELEKIIKELDLKCYRIINKRVKVAAYNKNEAIERVNMAINTAGIQVNGLIEISDGYRDFAKNPYSPYIYDCDCLCKESSQLVYILRKLLFNYQSKCGFKNQNNKLLDELINYQNSEELVPYEIRINDCYSKIKDFLNNNSKDLEKLKNLDLQFTELSQEAKQNEGYDVTLLSDLYQKALGCFKLILVSEIIHYKDRDNKVYELGVRK